MDIEEKRKVLRTITKLRSVLRENNISCHGLNNSGVVIAFAKLRFNEDLTGISKQKAYLWVDKMLNGGKLKNTHTPKKINKAPKVKAVKDKTVKVKTVESIISKVKPIEKPIITDWNEHYKKFLKTSYWKTIKEAVKFRDDNKCFQCGDNTKLVVHHLTYKNHCNEHKHLEDLVTLCEYCHNKIHSSVNNKAIISFQEKKKTEDQILYDYADVKTRMGYLGRVYFNEPTVRGKVRVYLNGKLDDSVLCFESGLIYLTKYKKQAS